ncbi:MAG: GntR family transcriptional regulator [Veillonellales bacterium]
MEITQVAKAVSYKEKIYEEIKTAIINRVLKPGEQLNERILADKLGISRTPLREAFKRLETEGWVVTEAWKGTYVTEITAEDIEEVSQLRMTLEVMVIELIIQKITPGQLLKIKELHQNQAQLGDEFKAGDFIELDRNFHMYLAELTGNKRLIQILANLSDMMRRLGITAIQTAKRYRETLQEHAGIITALEAKDLVKAKQAVLFHVLNTQKNIYKHWENRESQTEIQS